MNEIVRLNRQQEAALQKVADDFVMQNGGDVMKALKEMIALNGRMHETRGRSSDMFADHTEVYQPSVAHKLTGVQIGEVEQEGKRVRCVLTLGTLAGPFDFVITEEASGVIIEAMTRAQASMHGQRRKS